MFMLLMLVHSISTQEIHSSHDDNTTISDTDSNVTSHNRGKWYHVHLGDDEESNEINVNKLRSEYLSSTVLMKLVPYEYAMDDYQITVYENGLKNFLIEQFGSGKNSTLQIRNVLVIKNRIAMTNDRQKLFNEEDHVLHVTTTVLAEPNIGSSPLSSEDFSEMVVSYCSQFPENLILSWQAEEDETIDRGDDRFEDSITFGHVSGFKVETIRYEHENKHENRRRNSWRGNITGIAISTAIFFFCLCIPFLYLMIKEMKQRGSQNFNCVQDKACGDTDLISVLKLKSSGKRSLFPRRKNKYGIIESVITFENETDLPSTRSIKKKKHRYKKIDENKCPSISSSTDADTMSVLSSVDEESYDDESLASIQTSVLTGRHVEKKECCAPAGKLGVSIDTVGGQPVIHRVKEDSPLHSILQRLDIIVGVDEIDTSSMSAADVTLIMAKRMSKERRITFLRGVKKNPREFV